MQVGAGSATMGSPVFITVLTGMTLVMLLTGLVSWSPRESWQVWLVGAGVPIAGWLSFSLVASGGRSAIVATAVVLGVWLLVSLLVARSRVDLPLSLRYLTPLLLALAVVVGGYFGYDAGGRGAAKLQELGMLLSEERVNESNTTSRLIFYRTALDGLMAQPLRPYGVNAFVEVAWEAQPANFDALMNHYDYVPEAARETMVRQGPSFIYLDPESGQWVRRDTYHDKVHNYILDVWLAFGLVPLLLLVTFLALIFVRLIRARTPLSLGAAGAIAVYAIYAQAWFPAPATDPLLFILLGIGWGDAERALRPQLVEEAPKMTRADFRRRQRGRT
jgi:O-antigen ligase